MANVWTEGKDAGTLQPFHAAQIDSCFINERVDGLVLAGQQLTHAVFVGIGLKAAKFTNVDFSHSTFVRCYFRNAELRGCNFTGCRFVECDFPGAALINCQLQYSEWRDTSIDSRQILSNLPEGPNIASRLLEFLRANSLARGDGPEARRYLFAAMRCSREHYYRVAFAQASYYRDKYRGFLRIRGALRWIGLLLERLLWGYGESPALMFFWASILILGFAAYYSLRAPGLFGFGSLGVSEALKSAVQFSALAFASNTPNWAPSVKLAAIESAMVAESLVGIVFIGVIAAVVYRRISLRQGH
jgi:hypothetical protein